MAGANGTTGVRSADADVSRVSANSDDAANAATNAATDAAANDDASAIVHSAADGGASRPWTSGTAYLRLYAAAVHADDHGRPANVLRAATDAAATECAAIFTSKPIGDAEKEPIGTE